MNHLTKAGILIIVIGLSFLASTLYRSTSETAGFTIGAMFGLSPETWSIEGDMQSAPIRYFLVPRDYRMAVKTNATIDVYVLDPEGVRLWMAEGKLEPVFSYEGIGQQVITFHINSRDDYVLLVHNPSAEAAQYELSVRGYGIETDLLYLSLIILGLGAIVTIASLIPKGSSRRKQSLSDKSVVRSVVPPVAVLALLLLSLPIASCVAQSSSILAPIWMEEGTYANYDLTPSTSYSNGVPEKDITVFFLNGTIIKYRNVTSAFFQWECVQLRGDMATLNVSYSITSDLESYNFYTSALVDVNIASRGVYLQNGTLIGTTNLWLPSSPEEGQEVVLWDMPPERVTANVTTSFNGEELFSGQTPQGAQRYFRLENIGGTMNGMEVGDAEFQGGGYEYDTGLMLWGDLTLEPMRTALGIQLYNFPLSMTTNVDMGPVLVVIDWSYVLGVAAIVGSIVIVAALMIKRHRRRKWVQQVQS